MEHLDGLGQLAFQALEQIERLEAVQRELGAVQGHGRSPRGYVQATTGPGGALIDLEIADTGLRIGTGALAAEVTAAVLAAQQAFAQRAAELMTAAQLPAPPTPGEDIDAGMARLDELTATLEDLTRRLEQ